MATNLPPDQSSQQKLLDFCSKSKLPIPQFQKQTSKIGFYKILVWVEVPVPGLDEPKRFELEVSTTKRKEAESEASSLLLTQLQDWLSEHTPPDISQSKNKLNLLIQQNAKKFRALRYDHDDSIEALYFQCNVVVADAVIPDKEYSAVGRGRTKKDAEKDAAYKITPILREILKECIVPSSSGDKVEELQHKFSFPEHQLQYDQFQPDDTDSLLRFCKLSITKDGQPILIVAVCTGQSDEDAKQLCAEVFLQNLEIILQRLGEINSDQSSSTFD